MLSYAHSYRSIKFGIVALIILVLGVAIAPPAAAEHPNRESPLLILTAPDGRTFTATPSADGNVLVDSTIDPDGQISQTVAASLPGGEALQVDEADRACAVAGAVPSCVSITLDDPGIVTRTVRAQNDCPATVYIKFIIAFARDSDCLIATSGNEVSFAFDLAPGRYDGAETCG